MIEHLRVDHAAGLASPEARSRAERAGRAITPPALRTLRERIEVIG